MFSLIFFLPLYYLLANLSAGLLLVTIFKDQIGPILEKYSDLAYLLPASYLFAFSILGFTILGYFFRYFKKSSIRQSYLSTSRKANAGAKIRVVLPYLNLLLIFVIFISDFSNLFAREDYLWSDMGLVPGLFVLTAPVVVGLQKKGFLAHLNLSLVILYSFALATRASGLVPILFLSTRAAVKNIPTFLTRSFYILLVPFLYFLSLINRESQRHGLLFYFQNLDQSLVNISQNFSFWLLESVNNIGTSLIVLAATLEDKPNNNFGWDYIAVVFSPLSGQSVGWPEIFLDYRLHLFIPYSGLGEIINMSPVLVLAFVSFLFYLYGSSLLSYLTTPKGLSKALSGLASLFVLCAFILVFQYNARSVMRFVWLAAIFRIISVLLYKAKITKI
jgi:hypothetical protein